MLSFASRVSVCYCFLFTIMVSGAGEGFWFQSQGGRGHLHLHPQAVRRHFLHCHFIISIEYGISGELVSFPFKRCSICKGHAFAG